MGISFRLTRLSPVKWCYEVDSLVFGSTLKNWLTPLGLYSAVTYNANPFKLILRPPDFDLVPRKQTGIYQELPTLKLFTVEYTHANTHARREQRIDVWNLIALNGMSHTIHHLSACLHVTRSHITYSYLTVSLFHERLTVILQ